MINFKFLIQAKIGGEGEYQPEAGFMRLEDAESFMEQLREGPDLDDDFQMINTETGEVLDSFSMVEED